MAVEHLIRAARPSRKWGSQSFYTPMRGCKRLCVPPRRYTQLSRTMAPCKTFPIYSQPSRNDNNRSPRTVGTLRKAGIKFSLASPSRSSSRWADSCSAQTSSPAMQTVVVRIVQPDGAAFLDVVNPPIRLPKAQDFPGHQFVADDERPLCAQERTLSGRATKRSNVRPEAPTGLR